MVQVSNTVDFLNINKYEGMALRGLPCSKVLYTVLSSLAELSANKNEKDKKEREKYKIKSEKCLKKERAMRLSLEAAKKSRE